MFIFRESHSSFSHGRRQDEAGVVPCCAGEKPARRSERARQDGEALAGSTGVPAVHTPRHCASPHPGHTAHPEQPSICHPGVAVPRVSWGDTHIQTDRQTDHLRDTHFHHLLPLTEPSIRKSWRNSRSDSVNLQVIVALHDTDLNLYVYNRFFYAVIIVKSYQKDSPLFRKGGGNGEERRVKQFSILIYSNLSCSPLSQTHFQ